MKLTIVRTKKFALVNGVRTRIWNGLTDRGTPVKVYVRCLSVSPKENNAEFRALRRVPESEIKILEGKK